MVDKVETPVEAIKKEAEMLQAMVREAQRVWLGEMLPLPVCGFETHRIHVWYINLRSWFFW